MNNYRAYLSHAIRGKEGTDCPPEKQKSSCDAAIKLANEIREACPWLDLYVPAEHEEFIKIAFDEGCLTEQQILAVDCKIVHDCGVTIVYVPEGDELQGGRLVEHDFAMEECQPVAVVKNAAEAIEFLTERYNYSKHYGGDTW